VSDLKIAARSPKSPDFERVATSGDVELHGIYEYEWVRSYNLVMETIHVFDFDEEHQAVRLPKGFMFEGHQVYLKRVGNSVVILPFDKPWESLIDSLSKFSDDFMQERNQ